MDFAKLLARVQRLLLSPASEWDAIAGEPADVRGTYLNYVGPLVIAAALATAIGMMVFGINGMRMGPGYALTWLIISVLLQLIMVYVMTFVINALASQFGGTADIGQAFKVAAYSLTAIWVAGLLMIIPRLEVLVLLGSLYSPYLLYVGLPKLMKPAADKALIYVLTVTGAGIVLFFVIWMLRSSMLPAVTPMMGTP